MEPIIDLSIDLIEYLAQHCLFTLLWQPMTTSCSNKFAVYFTSFVSILCFLTDSAAKYK